MNQSTKNWKEAMNRDTKDRLELQVAATWDWLRDHPKLVWFVIGFTVGAFLI